jgi:hypothetical protein
MNRSTNRPTKYTNSQVIRFNACKKHITSSPVRTISFYREIREEIPYINLKMAAEFTFIARINRDCSRRTAPLYFCLMVGTLPSFFHYKKVIRKRNDAVILGNSIAFLSFPLVEKISRQS